MKFRLPLESYEAVSFCPVTKRQADKGRSIGCRGLRSPLSIELVETLNLFD